MLNNFSDYLHKTLSEKEVEEMNKNAEVVYQKPLEKGKKHYHYLIGYFFIARERGGGFGDIVLEFEEKINSRNIKEIRKFIEKAFEKTEGIKPHIISIISISPLECGCEDS